MAAAQQPQRRVVLVTGASSGIGNATAGHLRASGYRVYGASRRSIDGAIPWITLDVTDDASAAACIATILHAETRLDAVINCAGYGIAGAAEETSIEEAKAQFETNFFGTLRVCRAVLPAMRAQHAGLIVNFGSLAGLVAITQTFSVSLKHVLPGDLFEGLIMQAYGMKTKK